MPNGVMLWLPRDFVIWLSSYKLTDMVFVIWKSHSSGETGSWWSNPWRTNRVWRGGQGHRCWVHVQTLWRQEYSAGWSLCWCQMCSKLVFGQVVGYKSHTILSFPTLESRPHIWVVRTSQSEAAGVRGHFFAGARAARATHCNYCVQLAILNRDSCYVRADVIFLTLPEAAVTIGCGLGR